ncbi:Beta-barrel assembly machine subunit BamE [Pseudidiomarina indica]|uniref:Outer membrane protein assembly factor BamE n=1 Tax=Pseudidiomarina indica TaxID=1159017 RepID=A0A1G6DMI0_9GAMM|nr:outer membrane protein assembly factor BamE [Pseudidiomarina indica]SDB46383.1 Beta-barrel assembly machine subunit BamE [Pseudidiomarina indica]
MKALVILSSVVILSGCSVFENWVYRIDVPQGNFLEQRDIDQLRVGMTKEQVVYVIGKPVAENVFDDDVWFYVFDYNSGRSRSNNYQNKVKLTFENDRLKAYEGTFDRPENFDIPLEQ